jgi:hypothetical protein
VVLLAIPEAQKRLGGMIPLTKKRKVLIAFPIKKFDVDINFIRGLVSMLRMDLPDTEFDFVFCDGGSVAFARNEAAYEAEQRNFDRLLSIDGDMLTRTEQIERILSHDVDLVAGLYCKRAPGTPKWLVVPKKGAQVGKNGLLQCVKLATGFHNLRVSCLSTIRKRFPEYEFNAQEGPNDPVLTKYEWFPVGVVGPRTAEARLDKIKAIIDQKGPEGSYLEIVDALYSEQSAGVMHGEDYGQTRLLRKAGFKAYLDVGCSIIQHLGMVPYPITSEMVGYKHGEPVLLPEGEEDEFE